MIDRELAAGVCVCVLSVKWCVYGVDVCIVGVCIGIVLPVYIVVVCSIAME